MAVTAPAIQTAAFAIVWSAVYLAMTMTLALLVERVLTTYATNRRARIDQRYRPIVARAVAGDELAVRVLQSSPSRHRLPIAALIVLPLIDDRDPDRVARSRDLMRALSLFPVADRYLTSRLWWRRATALRVLGLLQVEERTRALVAALDDRHADVRGAALDALADLRNPASLEAIVVRILDPTLHRGRRVAALRAFGAACEPMLLDLAQIAPAQRVRYAAALAICGTARSRPTLRDWVTDPRPDVQAAAFDALASIGLDAETAHMAVDALDSSNEPVRAAAAGALAGWRGDPVVAAHLGRRLGDSWTVAARAAQSLRSMGGVGVEELRTSAARVDLAGLLARQMLWEGGV